VSKGKEEGSTNSKPDDKDKRNTIFRRYENKIKKTIQIFSPPNSNKTKKNKLITPDKTKHNKTLPPQHLTILEKKFNNNLNVDFPNYSPSSYYY